MIQLIAFVIFIISFLGVSFMLYRKMPALNTLPQQGKAGFKKYNVVVNLENKAREIVEYFDHIAFIHKIVSLIKILVLKIEVKVDALLHSLRKEAKIKNGKKQAFFK